MGDDCGVSFTVDVGVSGVVRIARDIFFAMEFTISLLARIPIARNFRHKWLTAARIVSSTFLVCSDEISDSTLKSLFWSKFDNIYQ